MDKKPRASATHSLSQEPPPQLSEGSGSLTLGAGATELDRGFAAMIESVDRLDDLGLGAVEPMTTFGLA